MAQFKTLFQKIDYIGFVFVSALFFVNGIMKIMQIDGVQSWMESYGIPGDLIYPAIIIEIVAPIMLVLGFKRDIAALTLMLFCIMTAFIFHSSFASPIEITAFLKNVALAGGLYFLIRFQKLLDSIKSSNQES